MVDKADETKKGTDTARPPKGDEASDLYSSATVVRDAPSDLKELIKQAKEGESRAITVPPSSPLPKDLMGTSSKPAPAKPATPSSTAKTPASGSQAVSAPVSGAKAKETVTSQTAKTSPPPSSQRKNEPPLSARKPDAPKKPEVPNKVDDLWEALLPKRSSDDDDDDDDGPSGSASGHAAEDVTKMLMVPEGLLPEDPLAELSPDALRRIAEAQPSIVVDAGIGATHSTVPPKKSSTPPRMSSEPPPSAAKPRKKDEEDEGIVTSPGRNVPPSDRQRIRSMVLAIGALVLLAIAVYYVAQP
jgi:hypothetical protein